MKVIMWVELLLMVSACSTEQSKQEDAKFIEQQNTIFRRVGYTINHGKCYQKGVDITPVIKVDKNIW
ncbi:MAG: hypothetical protein EOP45_13645 [Sphingobacteriaceae bacterium]|nr:MAG: hypothetical protein EOP45_13645 [Sphingobacteriaceae bacterium]